MTDDVVFKPDINEHFKQYDDYKPPLYDTTFITKQIPNLVRALRRIRVKLYYIKWTEKIFDEGVCFEHEYFEEDHREELNEGNFIYFSERDVYFAARDGKLHIQYDIEKELIPEFNEIMMDYFRGRTFGIVNTCEAITIQTSAIPPALPKEKVPLRMRIDFRTKRSTRAEKYHSDSTILSKPYVGEIQSILGDKGQVVSYDLTILGPFDVDLIVNRDSYKNVKKIFKSINNICGEPITSILWFDDDD